MNYFLLAQAVPLCIAVASFCLAGIVLMTQHRSPAQWWLAGLAAVSGLWCIGVTYFLLTHSHDVASLLVHSYYLAAACIPFCLVQLSGSFPRPRYWKPWRDALLVAGFAAIVVVSVMPGVLINRVLISDTGNTVELNGAYYLVYVLYFVLYVAIAGVVFSRQYVAARRRRQTRLVRQMRSMIAGMYVALLFGSWFNLILPLLGNYSLIWAGPPFTILFVIATFYTIIGQHLFDLRAALARSMAYFVLVASLFTLYWFVILGLTNLFFLGKQMTELSVLAYVVVSLLLTLTYAPLKKLIDRQTHRLFYRDEYNLAEVMHEFSDITAVETKLDTLVNHSLDLLNRTLAPEYIVAYVTDEEAKVHHYSAGSRHINPTQRRLQLDIVASLLDRMPRVVDTYDIKALGSSDKLHLVRHEGTSMILQFVVQGEHIGALFVGDKRNGRTYDDKDLQLLTTATDELSLAIQNSLRFNEIQNFNETLKDKISSATRRLRRTNRELQRLDEAKDEFVSMASHQLRTPLTSIKGYVSMVIEGDAGPITPQQKHLLSEAFASSERMVHLIADFLSVSRLQTGKFMVESRPIDLGDLVRHEVESMTPIAASHGQKIEYTSPVSRRKLALDESKIQQVVMNFMDNAVYYSPPGTVIEVELTYTQKEAVFTVKDHGIGVPKDEQKHLFGKFYRAENARKQRPDGTGVGLYLARKVIVAHGGKIIFSSSTGRGSTFGFRLPLN